MNFGNPIMTLLLASALALSAACSADTDKDAATSPSAKAPAAVDATNPAQVHDAIMANILPGIEGAFDSRGAKARWEGNVLHVKMDDNTNTIRPGWTECRVIRHFLEDNQTAVIEFSSGPLKCEDVLNES